MRAHPFRGAALVLGSTSTRLVEPRKILGSYDDSLVIVHSSHGARPGAADYPRDVRESAEWPDWLVEPLSAGLMLVSGPGARGFTTSPLPAQT